MSEIKSLLDVVLVAPATVVTQKGDSAAIELPTRNRNFLLTLTVSEAVEQEYIELWLQGSADGTTWAATPLATLPQRFYPGDYPTLVDLTADTTTRFLRVHWELSRWGRGELTPRFAIGITLKEVPEDLLEEARREANGRA